MAKGCLFKSAGKVTSKVKGEQELGPVESGQSGRHSKNEELDMCKEREEQCKEREGQCKEREGQCKERVKGREVFWFGS